MHVQWRKSTYSGGVNDQHCVELGLLACGIGVRDSEENQMVLRAAKSVMLTAPIVTLMQVGSVATAAPESDLVEVFRGPVHTHGALPNNVAAGVAAARQRALNNPELAPPYYDKKLGKIVAPVTSSSQRSKAARPLEIPAADPGNGVGKDPSIPHMIQRKDVHKLREGTKYTQPRRDVGAPAMKITPQVNIVANSQATLERIKDEVLQLGENELPGRGCHICGYHSS